MMFDLFLKMFLIVPMFFWWPNMQTYVPQEIMVQYLAMILLGVTFLERPRREIQNRTLWYLYAYLFLNTILFHFQPNNRMMLMNFFLGVLAYKVIAERFDFNFKKIGILMLVFLLANYLLMGLQVINHDPIYSMLNPQNKPQIDVVGFMGIAYALGFLGAFSVPFLYAINRWMVIFALPALYYGKSATAVVAAAIVVLWFFIPDTIKWIRNMDRLKSKIWVSVSTALAFLMVSGFALYYVLVIDMPTGQFWKRLMVWGAGLQLWKSQAWFGYGLGGWAEKGIVGIQENGQPEQWLWAHNEFLQYLFETGAVGVVFLYVYFKNLLKGFDFVSPNGRILTGAFTVLMIACFFHFPMHVGKFAALSIFILSAMEAHKHETLKRNFNRRNISSFDDSLRLAV